MVLKLKLGDVQSKTVHQFYTLDKNWWRIKTDGDQRDINMFRGHRRACLLMLLWKSVVLLSLVAHLMLRLSEVLWERNLKCLSENHELIMCPRCSLEEIVTCLFENRMNRWWVLPFRVVLRKASSPDTELCWSSGEEDTADTSIWLKKGN